MEPWIRTATGRNVNPLQLRPEDIHIEDIAHSLACINRFNGHTQKPINVAQHSVYVARYCEEVTSADTISLQGLLHDGAEAYIGDITKWVKSVPQMSFFRELEDCIQSLIFRKFGCALALHPVVEDADRVMVRYEGSRGFPDPFIIDHPNYPPLTETQLARIGKWGHWKWRESKELFLTHFRMYS